MQVGRVSLFQRWHLAPPHRSEEGVGAGLGRHRYVLLQPDLLHAQLLQPPLQLGLLLLHKWEAKA